MAPKYKLTYFNGRGAAEGIRYLLKYGNVDFEDERIKSEDWPQLKPKYTFGQLPVFEADGKVVNQSVAIARYVAKQVKLAGNNDWEDLEIDAIVDTINDFKAKFSALFREKDEKAKEALKENFVKETVPFYLDRFEAIAKKNNGHLVLGRLTWADFWLAAFLESLKNFEESTNSQDKYPSLKNVVDNVFNIPQVKKWRETRPNTPF